ncbi:hypothetical protein BGX29_002422 [Mortierella sp. GBA35]|nr:hypothetical protein BGX29_002422 [Mortierella sp. GBA35]
MAFHDAVALANWLNVLPTTQVKDLKKVFKAYKEERYPVIRAAYLHAKSMSENSSSTLKESTGTDIPLHSNQRKRAAMTRFISRHIPLWLWRVVFAKMVANRPQASFLPHVEDKGTVKPSYQRSYQEPLNIPQAKKAEAV